MPDIERAKDEHAAFHKLAAELVGIMYRSDVPDHLQVGVLLDITAQVARRLRTASNLIADLKAEGCPREIDRSGNYQVCAWCHAEFVDVPGQEPRADHVAMEDGGVCLYVRIMQA